MRLGRTERPHSLRFLVARGVMTVFLVLALLLGLKRAGIAVVEQDAPIGAVEADVAQEGGLPPVGLP